MLLATVLVKLDKILTVECTDCTTFTRGSHSLFQPAVTLEKERWKRVFGLSHVREGTTQELDIVVVHCSTSICVFFFLGVFFGFFFPFGDLGNSIWQGKKRNPISITITIILNGKDKVKKAAMQQ